MNTDEHGYQDGIHRKKNGVPNGHKAIQCSPAAPGWRVHSYARCTGEAACAYTVCYMENLSIRRTHRDNGESFLLRRRRSASSPGQPSGTRRVTEGPPGVEVSPKMRVLKGRERVTGADDGASVPSGRVRLGVRLLRGPRLLRAVRLPWANLGRPFGACGSMHTGCSHCVATHSSQILAGFLKPDIIQNPCTSTVKTKMQCGFSHGARLERRAPV